MTYQLFIKQSLLFISLLFLSLAAVAKTPDLNKELPVFKGDSLNLQTLIGTKPVYLKFWASWCQPCLKEMPHLQHSYEELGSDIHIIAVNIDLNETDADMARVQKQFGLSMPIVRDTDGFLAKRLKFVGTPYHILIDTQGDIVHNGHAANEKLDRKMMLLANNAADDLPTLNLSSTEGMTNSFISEDKTLTAVLFTATWCDWYLKDSRPEQSKHCIATQKQFNELVERHPDVDFRVVVSHLWTGVKELKDYTEKYAIEVPTLVDEHGDSFFLLKIKQLPTLVLFGQDKEVLRSNNVSDFEQQLSTL